MNMLKVLLVTIIAFALPGTVDAHYVHAPANGTVTATTYYSSGTFHGAVDIAPGASGCGITAMNTAVVQTKFWDVTIRTSSKVCYGNGSGHQNEAAASYANGWKFRQWHFNRSGSSYDRTCDRCTIGVLGGTGLASGPHAHLQYDRYGTKSTSWYSVSKGRYVYKTSTVGYLP
jgi:murein DD-endopeptidase MepM/ murein hydrolase activator NlpD